MFYAGDGHALQGNGEVDVTALEVGFHEARLRLTVVDRPALELPRAETPSAWITLGFGDSLDQAASQATQEMIGLIVELTGVANADAYALCSMCVDLEVTQAVNGIVGVHARLTKSLLEG